MEVPGSAPRTFTCKAKGLLISLYPRNLDVFWSPYYRPNIYSVYCIVCGIRLRTIYLLLYLAADDFILLMF